MVATTLLLPILFAAAMHLSSAADAPTSYYRNLFARTLGDSSFGTDYFRWICDFVTPETVFPSGVALITAPNGTADSYARYVQMVRCHERARAHFKLNELCKSDPHEWRRVAQRELRRCLHKSLTPTESAVAGSFPSRFNRASCGTRFSARVDAGNSQAVVLCICDQTQFPARFPEIPPIVSVGSARFSTLGVGERNRKELLVLQRCVEEELPGAASVCGAPGQDFNVLGRHLLEACCKRARTELENSKFECKELVPDDLTILNAAL